jgi:hypothetical protein
VPDALRPAPELALVSPPVGAAASGSDRMSTFTPDASSARTLSVSPSRAAKWSAVNPFFVCARGLAPASISSRTTFE